MDLTSILLTHDAGVDDTGGLRLEGVFAGWINVPESFDGITFAVAMGYVDAEPEQGYTVRLVAHRTDGVHVHEFDIQTVATDGPRAFVVMGVPSEFLAGAPGALRVDAHVLGSTRPPVTLTTEVR